LVVAPWFIDAPGLRWPATLCGLILAVTVVIAMRHQYADRLLAASRVLLAGIIIFQVPFQLGAMPAVEHIKLTLPIAAAINEKTTKDTLVASYKFNEPTLNFYVDRHIEELRNGQAVVAWSRRQNPGVLVIPRSVLADIEQRYGPLGMEEIASKKGINYSKGNKLELVALLCGPKSR